MTCEANDFYFSLPIAVGLATTKQQNQQACVCRSRIPSKILRFRFLFCSRSNNLKMLLSRLRHVHRASTRITYSSISSTDAAKIVTDKVFGNATESTTGKLFTLVLAYLLLVLAFLCTYRYLNTVWVKNRYLKKITNVVRCFHFGLLWFVLGRHYDVTLSVLGIVSF